MSGCLLRSGGAVAFLLALAGQGLTAPPHVRLLPGTTKEYISAPDVRKLNEPWDQTQFARVLKDPALAALAEQLTQRQGANSDMQRRLGIGWDEVRAVAQGEASWALIQAGQDKHAAVLLIDVTGKADQARAHIAEALAKRGVTTQTSTTQGTTQLTLNGRQVYHLIKDDTFVAADDQEVLDALLARFGTGTKDTLEDLPAFQAVFKQVQGEAREPVHLRWFIEPLGRADVLRASLPKAHQPMMRDWLKILRAQGFDNIKGVGGIVSFGQGDFDLLSRLAVFAPRPQANAPYPKAMGMAALLPLDNPAPQPWVPDRLAKLVSTFMTGGADIVQAFGGLGFLIDASRRDPGYFEDLMETYRTGKLKVDVRKEIVGLLGKRVTVLNDYRSPVDGRSERRLFAFELASGANGETVASALRRLLEPDDKRVRKHTEAGSVVWEIEPEPNPDEPSLVSIAAIGVWKGHLLIGSSVEVVLDFLRQDAKGKRLADAEDYQRFSKALDKLGATASSARFFTRPESDFFVPYVRWANKLAESQSMVAQVFGMLMGLDRRNGDKSKFDGSKLPEFKAVAQYLGPIGGHISNRDDGWVGVVFVLKK